jgi:hypothetical protein
MKLILLVPYLSLMACNSPLSGDPAPPPGTMAQQVAEATYAQPRPRRDEVVQRTSIISSRKGIYA